MGCWQKSLLNGACCWGLELIDGGKTSRNRVVLICMCGEMPRHQRGLSRAFIRTLSSRTCENSDCPTIKMVRGTHCLHVVANTSASVTGPLSPVAGPSVPLADPCFPHRGLFNGVVVGHALTSMCRGLRAPVGSRTVHEMDNPTEVELNRSKAKSSTSTFEERQANCFCHTDTETEARPAPPHTRAHTHRRAKELACVSCVIESASGGHFCSIALSEQEFG